MSEERIKTMKANMRFMSNESYKQWNVLDNRAFSLSCLYMGLFLQESFYYTIDMLRSYMQTEFVYLFMPWHRHALG